MVETKTDWVVVGGKHGETAHCTRCGKGLDLPLPMELYLAAACMNAFVEHHSECQPGLFHEPPVITLQQWWSGRDTGISSLTICEVLADIQSPFPLHDVPYDPDDFGRCYRLLKLFPAWRDRLGEVAARFPEWAALVERWDEMTKLYEEEEPTGICRKLYDLMQTLRPQAHL